MLFLVDVQVPGKLSVPLEDSEHHDRFLLDPARSYTRGRLGSMDTPGRPTLHGLRQIDVGHNPGGIGGIEPP
jgi:hypothetical protein